MAQFEYSKFDGSEQFSPQSADKVFDELTQHMLDWGDHVSTTSTNGKRSTPTSSTC